MKNKGYNINIWRPAMFKVFTALHTSHTQMMDLIRFSQPSAAHILKNIDFLGVSLFGGSLGGALKKTVLKSKKSFTKNPLKSKVTQIFPNERRNKFF